MNPNIVKINAQFVRLTFPDQTKVDKKKAYSFLGSVYFIVKTAVEATTERKSPKQNTSNYAPTERYRKTERMPKEQKQQITSKDCQYL